MGRALTGVCTTFEVPALSTAQWRGCGLSPLPELRQGRKIQTGPPRSGAGKIWEFLEFTQPSPEGVLGQGIILKGERAAGHEEP